MKTGGIMSKVTPPNVKTDFLSIMPLVNDLRDAHERNPAHSLYEDAADMLDSLYERLVLATGVIDKAGILWMGETETKRVLAKARGENGGPPVPSRPHGTHTSIA
jgi:hypothetical protein